jgi:hypothetical protein
MLHPYLKLSTHMTLKQEIGWSIWTFTDLDWAIIGGLHEKGYVNYCEDLEEGQRLLAECRGDGI